MRLIFVILAILGVAATAAGCGQASSTQGDAEGPRTVEVAMKEYSFVPGNLSVRPGEKVRFVVTNRGREDHEFEGEEIGLEEILVPPGRERETNWTAPQRPGAYQIVCDLPGHRERGMVMEVTVQGE